MHIFLTGAKGFIDGVVASAPADGQKVRGLVRDQGKASGVAAHGIEPVIGALCDTASLQTEARASVANSDHLGDHQSCGLADDTLWNFAALPLGFCIYQKMEPRRSGAEETLAAEHKMITTAQQRVLKQRNSMNY